MAAATATWYHCSIKTISRSNGRTAIAAAAYRSGARLHDNQLDKTHDYTRRQGVETSFIVAGDNVPQWLLGDEPLWNEAQAKDNRKNSCLAREIELALPSGIDAAGRAALVRDFSLHLVERYGVAVSAAVHEPSRHGDENNYHAHILFTTRRVDENGFGAKTRELDVIQTSRGEVEHIREYAATLINSYLEDAGSEERVDHRSFKDRGIDRTPTEHMGVEASAMERRGEPSRIGDENRDIAEHNRSLDELATLDAEISRELEAEPEPPLSWEEQKRQAVSAFTDKWTLAYMGQELEPSVVHFDNNEVHTARPEAGEPPGKSIFDIPPAPAWIEQVREPAEVEETGWYDYTVTTFNLIYRRAYDAARTAIDAAKAIRDRGMDYWDSWQQRYLAEKDRELDPGRDIDMDRW